MEDDMEDLKKDLKLEKKKITGIKEQLKEAKEKEILLAQLEVEMQEIQSEFKNALALSQNATFEKRQLMQQIDKLEECLEIEKAKKTVVNDADNNSIQKNLTMAINPVSNDLEELDMGALLDDASLVQAEASPDFEIADVKDSIVMEVAEEDKDSAFGDYGDSSESEADEEVVTKDEEVKPSGTATVADIVNEESAE